MVKGMARNKRVVTTEVKNFIIQQAIAGYTSQAIADHIKEKLNVDIADDTVRAVRVKYRKKIVAAIDKVIETASATQPLASLEKRLAEYEKNIRREINRKTKDGRYAGDGRVINDALRFAAEDIATLHQIRLKMEELELKKNGQGKEENGYEKVAELLERRVRIWQSRDRSVDEKLIANSDWRIIEDGKDGETQEKLPAKRQ
jgi:hypothetical protein